MTIWTPAIRTLVHPRVAAVAFAEAYRNRESLYPAARTLATLLGHSAFETGHWKHCYNWNLGNVRGPAGLWTYYPCSEVRQGAHVYYHPTLRRKCPDRAAWLRSHPESIESDKDCRFRAFDGVEDGFAAHAELLWRRFPRAVHEARTGSSADFALALHKAGYYTLDPKIYAGRFVPVAQRYLPLCVSILEDLWQRQVTRSQVTLTYGTDT